MRYAEDGTVEVDPRIRRLVSIVAIIGASIFFGSFLLFLIYWSWADQSWIIVLAREHFAAIVGAPLAAFASLLLVLFLRYTAGPIELETLGFKIKGGAGPLMMWIFCYLAIVTGIKLLW